MTTLNAPVEAWVPGRPRPQGSLTAYGRGKVSHPAGLIAWRNRVILKVMEEFGRRPPLDEPVILVVSFLLPRGRARADRRYPDGQGSGDLDKLVRAIGDAVEKIVLPKGGKLPGVLKNDARIVGIVSTKEFADRYDIEPGALVALVPVGEYDLRRKVADLARERSR